MGLIGDRAVTVAEAGRSWRDGWVRITDGSLDMSAPRYGCVTHGKGAKKSSECVTAAPIRAGGAALLACMDGPPTAGAPLEGWYTAAPDRAEGAAVGQWAGEAGVAGGRCLRIGERGSLLFWRMYLGLGIVALSEAILIGGMLAMSIPVKSSRPA